MPGDPQPLISNNGDECMFNLLINKELSERLVGLQNQPITKSDDVIISGSFSSICRGFRFLSYNSIVEVEEENERVIFYADPCLYIYWTDCCDPDKYKSQVKPDISKWIEAIERVHKSVNWLIVYCVTKETKAKKKQLGEKIKNDFCTKPEQYSILKLTSSDETRVQDSWSALVTKINTLCFAAFQQSMQPVVELVNKMADYLNIDNTYEFFLNKLDVAIGYEMCCQYEQALGQYNELHLLLEQSIMKYSSETHSKHPLKKMLASWHQCWDCPDLTHPERAWKYLKMILSGKASLITVRTFIFMREASLLSMLCRSWLLAERALQVLHSTARETRALKFNYPDGVFEAWAYMTCMETVSAILSQLHRASLEDMTASLLLIRAGLWEYGLRKLYKLGQICQLVPTSEKPDDLLISRITAGISPCSSIADREYDDQGQLLIEMLLSKNNFTTKYLELGEMVIGAYKHAGRKRTAFTVGLHMAELHMNLGLIQEAEQLLDDICSLYCPENWTMFSANAASLLAECQKTLHLDTKYLRSLLMLTVLPTVAGTSHDPSQCLDEIVEVSKTVQGDVVLDFRPLFSDVKVTPDDSECIVGNTVTVTTSLFYHGQKDLMLDRISLLLRTSIRSLLQSPEISGQSLCSGMMRPMTLEDTEQTFTVTPDHLHDLDIDADYSDCSDYRALSDAPSHARKTLSETFSSYSLDQTSTGVDVVFEEDGNEPEFEVSNSKIVLHPGENEIKQTGKPMTCGQYYGRKLTLGLGQLSFVSVLTSTHWNKGLPILLKPVDISFGIEPMLGAFYAGVVQECKLTLATGSDNPIPPDSVLRLSCNTGIKFISKPDTPERLSEMLLTLPTISQCSDWSETLLLYLPSIYREPNMLMGEGDFVFTAGAKPTAWNHEIVVHCQWLMPIHIATLPVISPEPLSVQHHVYCTSDRSFLQFSIASHWPRGLKLCQEQLSVPDTVSSESIQSPVPEVLYNEESYSYLWELRSANVATNFDSANSKCLLEMSSELVMDNDVSFLSVDHRYPFNIPGVNALYCVECTVEPTCSERVTENSLCQLKITIKCCSPLGTDCPKKFRYSILHDVFNWRIPQGGNGTASVENNSKTVQIRVDIMPQMYGELPVPIVDITEHSRRSGSIKGSGQEDVFVLVDKSLVYNSSRGIRIYVYSDSGHLLQ